MPPGATSTLANMTFVKVWGMINVADAHLDAEAGPLRCGP
jgi:hypothetical protein